jgi:general secretion pathway protein J
MTARATQLGLTLIELLIAVALMAILSLLGWRGLDALMHTQEVTQKHTQYTANVQTSLAQSTTLAWLGTVECCV